MRRSAGLTLGVFSTLETLSFPLASVALCLLCIFTISDTPYCLYSLIVCGEEVQPRHQRRPAHRLCRIGHFAEAPVTELQSCTFSTTRLGADATARPRHFHITCTQDWTQQSADIHIMSVNTECSFALLCLPAAFAHRKRLFNDRPSFFLPPSPHFLLVNLQQWYSSPSTPS